MGGREPVKDQASRKTPTPPLSRKREGNPRKRGRGDGKHTTAVVLAGTLRASPLRQQLDIPTVCLPVCPNGSLLDAWRDALGDAGAVGDIRVVVNTEADIEPVATAAYASSAVAKRSIRILTEPAAWRGTGGIVRDVTADLDENDRVLVIEANCFPPPSLTPLVEALGDGDAGVIGVAGDGEPAGASLLTVAALSRVPRVGYYDIKEQLLPALHRDGLRVRTATLGTAVRRIRDLGSYLEAVRSTSTEVRPGAGTAGTTLFDGVVLIEAGVVIEEEAVVHDSVVMAGARIGRGAVVSRSVVGPGAVVEPGARIISRVVAADRSRAASLMGA